MLDNLLLSKLKEWRKEKSRSLQLPAYYIFKDSTLELIAKKKPKNKQELYAIDGVGVNKLDRFGKEILSIVSSINKNTSKTKVQEVKKEGLFEKISRKLNEFDPRYSITYEEIPVSTKTARNRKIPNVYSYDRDGYETDIVTVNEKKYRLFLVIDNIEKKLLISGTKEHVANYCNTMLELLNKAESSNSDELLELLNNI